MRTRLALGRVNYSQLYGMYDGGKTYKHRDILAPYQLLTLAGYIRTRGVEVRIFDGEVALMNQAQLVKKIIDWKPQFVGLTATTPDIELTANCCRLIKQHDSSIVTIIGGAHATAMPEDVARYQWVDYVVVGDGEEPLAQIIKEKRSSNQSVEGKIVKGKRRDISRQPMPAHDLLDYSEYKFTDPTRGQLNTASVMSSRGCPFDCFFCFHDRHLRCRNIDNFIFEIEYLYRQKNVRYYYIYDDTFMVNNKRALEIAKRIESLDIKDANFQCLTRAELVEPYLIEALRQANFTRVSMGIESGSEEILNLISKGVTKEDCLQACRILIDHGIETRASFIFGLPYETKQTAIETINFCKQLDLLHANFNIMMPYPGTRVYQMALRGKGLYFERAEYARQWQVYRRWGKAIIRTEELSASDLEALQVEAQVEFYSQPKIFDYYRSLFERGNRSRYFYRPLNFAWQRKFGRSLPFWNRLKRDKIVKPN